MSRTIALLTLVFLLCAGPCLAGELVLDNFSNDSNCCVEFEVWSMGSAESRILCAGPQRRERFSDGLAAVGKMKATCRRPGEAAPEKPPRVEARFVPEGIYSPLSGYRVEVGPSGSISFNSID